MSLSEDVVVTPEFQRLVPHFTYYLRRHIELNRDAHGPAAARVIATQVAHSPRCLCEARGAARASLIARRRLWEGTLALLQQTDLADSTLESAAVAA